MQLTIDGGQKVCASHHVMCVHSGRAVWSVQEACYGLVGVRRCGCACMGRECLGSLQEPTCRKNIRTVA